MASAAAIFDKLSLQSDGDLLVISNLLENAHQEYIKNQGTDLTPNLKASIQEHVNEALKQMKQFIVIEDDDAGPLTPGGLKSPMLPPLSPPPSDAEVVALEAQVEDASNRVSALRVTMQSAIQERLAAKLAEYRPVAEVSPPEPSATDPDPEPMSPAVTELRARLTEASAKMPELMARLEDAQSRLDRVMNTSSHEITSHDRPLNTVEQAVLGVEGHVSGDQTANPALTEAVNLGQVATRRGRQSTKSLPSAQEIKEEERVNDAPKETEGGDAAAVPVEEQPVEL